MKSARGNPVNPSQVVEAANSLQMKFRITKHRTNYRTNYRLLRNYGVRINIKISNTFSEGIKNDRAENSII